MYNIIILAEISQDLLSTVAKLRGFVISGVWTLRDFTKSLLLVGAQSHKLPLSPDMDLNLKSNSEGCWFAVKPLDNLSLMTILNT